MAQDRVKGYVLGQDKADGVLLWKVRVTDEFSPFLGEKLFVASVKNNVSLAQGLEVDFIVGTFTGRNKEAYHKVVDVAPVEVRPKCDFCSERAEIGLEVSSDDSGAAEYARCCLPDFVQAVELLKTSTIPGRKQIKCMNFSASDHGWRKLSA